MFQVSLEGVSRKFQGNFKKFESPVRKVSMVFLWCFKEVSRVFQESVKGISRKFHGCFKEV